MAGALSRIRGYADGGDVLGGANLYGDEGPPPDDPNEDYGQEDDPGYQDAGTAYDDAGVGGAGGALTSQLAEDAAPDVPASGSEGDLGALAHALIGKPEDVTGALSQQTANRHTAEAEKIRLIQQARSRLEQYSRPDEKMQFQAWLNGLGAPQVNNGNSIAQSMTNSGNAEMAEKIRQQAIARAAATGMGNLDIIQGNAGIQATKDDWSEYKDRLTAGREAEYRAAQAANYRRMIAERAQAALQASKDRQAAADQRADAARQASLDRQDAIDQRRESADQGRFTYQAGMGPDPNDPNKQVQGTYQFDTRHPGPGTFYAGQVQTGRGGTGGGSTALEKNAEFYVRAGVAPDLATAINMLKSSVNDPATFQRLVQGEKRNLIANGKVDPTTGEYIGPYTDQEAETIARQNVQARAALAQKGAANTATNPGFRTNIPFPGNGGAQPAAAKPAASATGMVPSSVAPSAAPAAAGAIPPRPATIPRGASWSPSRKAWFWQENGVWKSAPGA